MLRPGRLGHYRRMPHSRRLLALAITLVLGVGCVSAVLWNLDAPVRTPVGAAGAGKGSFPVVLIAGLHSTGAGFAPLTAALRARGVPLLDFDPQRPGVQPFTYSPASSDDHVPFLAANLLQPAIKRALAVAGFDPEHQVVDVVAHSYGGLLARFLVEHPGADVDRFSPERGWYGDGTPDVDGDWAARVDDLVLVGTPNHGSELGFRLVTAGPGMGEWDGVGGDIRPDSPFLRRMGKSEPPGEVYTTIGGDPVGLRWLRDGHHGFDGAVPAESPFLAGAANNIFPQTHGKLLSTGRSIQLILETLALSGG